MATATIGHNAPPPDVAFSLEIDSLFSLLSDSLNGTEVTTDEQEAAIDALKADFLKASQDADKARADEKKPHDDAAKAVQTKWKPIIDKATRGKLECIAALTPYRAAKQAAKDAAVAKAREEAEALAKAAQDALRGADDLDAKYAAETQLAQAQKLTAVANKIDRSATGLRTYWTHRIVNRKQLLLHVLDRHPEDLADMLNELVRRQVAAGARAIPGVEIIEEKRAA